MLERLRTPAGQGHLAHACELLSWIGLPFLAETRFYTLLKRIHRTGEVSGAARFTAVRCEASYGKVTLAVNMS